MIINSKNCLELIPDETYQNIIPKLKDTLLEIQAIKNIDIPDIYRKSVTEKIFNRIHWFINSSSKDINTNLNDIVTYLSVPYVNIPAIHLIYKAVTNRNLPPIIPESYTMTQFVSMGYKILTHSEKNYFKNNYSVPTFVLRKPTFSGSSVVNKTHMKFHHNLDKYKTPFEDLISYLENKGDIKHIGDDFFMTDSAYKAEEYIKSHIGEQTTPLVRNEKEIFVDKIFSEEQTNAVKGILTSKSRITALTGRAGTGKTSVISNIVDNASMHNKNIVCCAFTGKAASRMEQTELDVNKLLYPPKTIHSLIGTIKTAGKIVDIDLIIIDEASTMNSELFWELIQTLEPYSTLNKMKFIFVGDFNQLPPIGGGQIFEDILELELYPIYRLTHIYRTTDKDLLNLYNDVLTYNNVKIMKHKKYFKVYNKDDSASFLERIVTKLFEKDSVWYKNNKCVILAHTNKIIDYINYLSYKHITGKTINYYETLLGSDDDKSDWTPLPVFWKGAKIVFTYNDRIDVDENNRTVRVTNGTVGEVLEFMDDLVLIKNYDDDSTFYIRGDYDTIKLAYAMTVHKAQGSEAQFIIYVHGNSMFESKRLVYTAITRAKQNLKIYCPVDGFKMSLDVERLTNINSQ